MMVCTTNPALPQPLIVWLKSAWDALGSVWLQNIILALTATIGLCTYIFTAKAEKRRATVDVLLNNLSDKEADSALTEMRLLVDAGLDIPFLLSKDGLAKRRILLSVLNRYEFMASGLKMGAFDRAVYKRMYYSAVVRDWKDLQPFVKQYRETRKIFTAYQDVEALYKNWQKHPLKAERAEKPSRVKKIRTIPAHPADTSHHPHHRPTEPNPDESA